MHLFFHKDFFIDITSVDSRTKVLERETIGRVERIVDKWESDGAKLFPFEQRAAIEAPAEDDNKDNAAAEGGSAATSIPMQVLNSQSSAAVLATMEGPSRNKRGTAASGRASFFSQVAILTRRNYISSWRDWRGLLVDYLTAKTTIYCTYLPGRSRVAHLPGRHGRPHQLPADGLAHGHPRNGDCLVFRRHPQGLPLSAHVHAEIRGRDGPPV